MSALGRMQQVAGPAILRMLADVRAVMANVEDLCGEDVREPRVTLDLPGEQPEPFHVCVHGTAREFGIAGALTGSVIGVTFHIWVTVVASGGTAEQAVSTANDYQALLLQIPLNDVTLGGTVDELGAPQVREAESWSDPDGRRHAGYLLEFEALKRVAASPAVAAILEAIE